MAMSDRMRAVFAETFGLDADTFSLEMAPEDVPQWDSLGHMRLVMNLEQTFGIQFEVDEITEMSSGRKIIELLQAKGIKD